MAEEDQRSWVALEECMAWPRIIAGATAVSVVMTVVSLGFVTTSCSGLPVCAGDMHIFCFWPLGEWVLGMENYQRERGRARAARAMCAW